MSLYVADVHGDFWAQAVKLLVFPSLRASPLSLHLHFNICNADADAKEAAHSLI